MLTASRSAPASGIGYRRKVKLRGVNFEHGLILAAAGPREESHSTTRGKSGRSSSIPNSGSGSSATTLGLSPEALAVGDANGDGTDDIAVTGYDPAFRARLATLLSSPDAPF
jgi:hypothetical protein